jgi:ribosomal protein L37AE/L43A
MTVQSLTLIFSTTGIGYLMVKAGLGKHALEHRRKRRVCPSCGRQIVGRTCNGH